MVVLVTWVFFLILTVQKTQSLTLLRAVGASNGYLLGTSPFRWRSSPSPASRRHRLLCSPRRGLERRLRTTVDPASVIVTTGRRSSCSRCRLYRRDAPCRQARPLRRHPASGGRRSGMKTAWRELIAFAEPVPDGGCRAHPDRCPDPVARGHCWTACTSAPPRRSRRSRRACSSTARTANDSFFRSRLDAPTRARGRIRRRGASGRAATGLTGQLPAGHIRAAGAGRRRGVRLRGANEQVPAPPPHGQGYVDRSFENTGVAVGRRSCSGRRELPSTLAGWVEDTTFTLQGGIWMDPETWRAA